ncbi:Putative 6-phosphogluconate dehydrogenase, NADP-binding, 6-phosphogluconate dehydrogenase, domain 2 [Colletotrichum destructivum]|uniref:6-phosphogluconate dehydrogenase, NADP-binding, 6-phosphogluconate dehydrogenase, domain 2 n=1 Tax=Colletotrichum destructivum TaxID=34406 RepID=A0AAX4J3U1_9PEZI|nr:Putative 6-phosphogluconate dehydrogenase, NADP-binding, 6-phosphogluconate dehydrogenase, domain 2 [Colletotrichum destructivum]
MDNNREAEQLTPHPRLGWIGLGSMGIGMAINLQKHLSKLGAPNLQYHNRTMSRGDPLAEIGGVARPEVEDLVRNTDIIFVSLSDDAAIKATLDAILGATAPLDLTDKIIVDTSTVHPLTSAKSSDRLAERNAKFVAAPVFGASPVAAEGKLLWIIAGPHDAVEDISPFVVGVMGRGIIRLGEDVQQSSMMKTAGNFMTAGMMELVAEAHVFAEKTGLGTDAMERLIEQQYGPLALSMSKRMTTGAYMPPRGARPWSDLTLALKDVGHGIDCAEKSNTRLEVGEVVLRHLSEAKRFSDAEGRPLDSSSMYGVLRREAGLPFETELILKRDSSGV